MQDDANDSQQDEFMTELIQAGMAAIQDEGSASAIFPILVRGPKDELAAVRQVMISRPEGQRSQDRSELIGRMATTLDLPAEVLTGKGDLNHWTAWAVSDDTFSDHIEPLVMVIDDALTAGYMRLALKETSGLDADWVSRVIIWHDPTRLVRHPDRSQDALQAYDRLALSDAALRDTMGFSDTDAPDADELLIRLLVRQNRLDPTITAQIIKRLDSSLDISGVTPEKKTAEPGQQDEQPGGPGLNGGPNSVAPSPTPPAQGPPQGGQPSQENPMAPTPAGVAASLTALTATASHVTKGNRALSKIESQLFDNLLTASNASMSRALEKAGARIRTTVGRTASGRAWCASHSNLRLCFLISNAMISAAGLDEQILLNNAWESLKDEYMQYVEYADQRALDTVASMLKTDPDQMRQLAGQLAQYKHNGWNYLYHQLQRTGMGYLSDASNTLDVGEAGEITTTRLVEPQIVKNAIARAGGALEHAADSAKFDPTVSVAIPTPGLTTGPAVSSALQDGGLGIESYTWVHGFTPSPFEPHLALDGVEFSSWTDEVLLNDDEFPDRDYFMPGDHDGCSCDFHVNWSDAIAAAGRPKGPALAQFYEDQPRAEGGKFGEGKENGDSATPADRAAAIEDAKQNAGMARQTAARLYDAGKLDDAAALAQTQQDDAVISSAQDTADEKYDSYAATITDEDRQAAEERHAASYGRAGGDDRPGPTVRARYQQQMMTEFGDGEHAPCIYCGRTLEPDTATLERLVPGREGGLYVMPNLAPACYDCNNWRGNADYHETMAASKEWLSSSVTVAAAAVPPQPSILPLGTWVTAKCVGYTDDPSNTEVTPIAVPLEEVSGKLDGYWVGTFGYFKYIVAGYDVEEDSIKPAPEAEAETAEGDQNGSDQSSQHSD
jgi:hypothetical protein